MGGSIPKPDYVAGMRRSAFDQKTWDSLQKYATPDTPVLLSQLTCYPLVLAEARSGAMSIQEAMLQAIHAAAIAVKAQIKLHWEAYGEYDDKVKELYGEPLVFTICHDHDEVQIMAHYALLQEGKLQFHYSRLKMLSLTMNQGRDQNLPNTFVENVYRMCGPLHSERIRGAAKKLSEKEPKNLTEKESDTDMSFGASQPGLGDDDSQDSVNNVFKKPSLSPSVMVARELAEFRTLMEKQTADLKEQLEMERADFKAQLEQAREESKK